LYKNPTQDRLEKAFALLGVERVLLFTRLEMGAAITLLLALDRDSHVIFPEDVYAHVRVAHEQYLPKWNFQVSVVDMEDQHALDHAIRPNTKLVWVETPSNPRCRLQTLLAPPARRIRSVHSCLSITRSRLQSFSDLWNSVRTLFCTPRQNTVGATTMCKEAAWF
jgi:cystathionine beta-lyase/cystathionine gamma-synthase